MKRIPFVLLLLCLLPGWAWGATVYSKNIAGTVYYQSGVSSCDDITDADTAGDLEAASDAAGAGGTLNICAGTYTDTNLDSDGFLTVNAQKNIYGIGTVLLKAGQTAVKTVRFSSTSDNSIISNIQVEVQDLGAGLEHYGIAVDSGSDGTQVLNCTITCVASPSVGSDWTGIATGALNTIISGCDVSLVRNGIQVGGGGIGALVTGNTVYDLKAGTDATSDGIIVGGGVLVDHTGTVISNNIVHGYKDDGIDLFWGSNVLVTGNEVYSGSDWTTGGADGYGIKCGSGSSTGNRIIGNYVHDIKWNSAIYSNDADNLTIWRNRVINVMSGGDGIAISSPTDGAIVVNNTIDLGTGGRTAISTGTLVTGTVRIQNNILKHGGAASAYDFNAQNATIIGGYNIFVNDAAVEGSAGYINTNSSDLYSTDPLFTSAGTSVFTLQSTSPAIHTGTSAYIVGLEGKQTKSDGTSVNINRDYPLDIGAYPFDHKYLLSIRDSNIPDGRFTP